MSGCLFCKIIAGEIPSYKIYENDDVYAFLDIYPVAKYHTLVIPKEHSLNIYDTTEENLQKVISAVKHITTLYKDRLDIDQVNIVSNNGSHAQQEIGHVHYHIIPRAENDGLDVHRANHPERQEKFEAMLEKLL